MHVLGPLTQGRREPHKPIEATTCTGASLAELLVHGRGEGGVQLARMQTWSRGRTAIATNVRQDGAFGTPALANLKLWALKAAASGRAG